MDEKPDHDEPIHISSKDARGAGDADDGTRSDALLPMLIIGLVLVVLGVSVMLIVVR